MASYDFNAPRLFVDHPLRAGSRIALDRAQANYLLNVLRLGPGGSVLVFNGRDGEWRAEIAVEGRKAADLVPAEQVRAQTAPPDLLYLFAPLKHARLDYMVQKAVEMGAGALRPVFTRRTQSSRVNLDRMRANVIEAAEQCGILSVPEVLPELDLDKALRGLEPDRTLIFCDEDAPPGSPVNILSSLRNPGAKLAVIVGPEGGFTDQERALVAAHDLCIRVSLGPRILRADTAAVAVLALVQATLGDWGRSDGPTTG
ncbi:16S rRNA (uracil(1498)-N(3))-methyltransferase [Microvirga pudoricolor]|uniref:16S rRNA (uracil(1498)-N(3))-methyltransferase n=1 Tax=Microvirga pudoricolor TaxID=2778729 RepID=UPI00194F3CC9|nr:16S rRNA (uracil(1498)-N(3))-methyltransferase [Microvirga pudoricolor]MBM6592698.1 16S rRNA (uracil(1498)-N(3))-methyltransferase [Microvirga pudoricolor]